MANKGMHHHSQIADLDDGRWTNVDAYQLEFEEVMKLSETERGEGGYGSSGK